MVFYHAFSGFHDTGASYAPIELVDVYGMFCYLLGIDPESNDGVWDRIRRMLRNSSGMTRPSMVVTAMAAMTTARYYWH